MSKYSLAHTQSTLTTTYKTSGLIAAAAANASGVQIRRGKLYEVDFGQSAAPNSTDCAVQWDVSRNGSASLGTMTSLTPSPLDSADAATNAQGFINATGEPTIATAGNGLSLLNFSINQRAAYRWIAAPGSELVYPATASNGLVIRALSTNYAAAAGGTALYEEQ